MCTQVDPNFTYAYTLLGHEHIATEELDSALSCYRSAVRIDPRHYNAWYVFLCLSHYNACYVLSFPLSLVTVSFLWHTNGIHFSCISDFCLYVLRELIDFIFLCFVGMALGWCCSSRRGLPKLRVTSRKPSPYILTARSSCVTLLW